KTSEVSEASDFELARLSRSNKKRSMAANTYECMFLLDPAKVSGDATNAAKQVESILTKNNAEVLASRQWDERRLAYPVTGHKKGLYYCTYFLSEGKNLVYIDQLCPLTEALL